MVSTQDMTATAQHSKIAKFIASELAASDVVDVARFKRDVCATMDADTAITLENALTLLCPQFLVKPLLWHSVPYLALPRPA